MPSAKSNAAATADIGFVVDLNAHRAQRAEARREPTTVRLGDETFAFAPVTEWPIEIVDLLGSGEIIGALRMLLDDDDYRRFLDQQPTMGDVADLFESLGRNAGIGGLGNSPDSARS